MRNSLRVTGSFLNWAPAAFAVLAACSDGGGDDGDADNTPPSIQIVSPADGSSFVETDTITVSVQVTDPDESDLSVLDLAWAVDASTSPGPAQADGSGAASYDLTLPTGTHQVVVTVSDPAGETAINTINLIVAADADGDGYGPPEDCDDTNADVHPDAVELCNDIDDDCLNGPDDSVTFVDWYTDADADGYGDPASAVSSCEDLSATLVEDGTDCDDNVAATNPGATEICNDVDDDCANGADDGLLFQSWFADADMDGFGNPVTEESSCEDLSATHILDGTDCNDLDATKNHADADADGVDSCSGDCNDADPIVVPGAPELCNDLDDNCVGGIDEGIEKTNWYIDADLDSYGDPASVFPSCFDQSATHILDGTDCNDQDAALNHDDADVDGTDSCTGDCNDLDPAIFPGAADICNDIDDNCAGGIDEGLVKTDWYVDSDLDNFGDPATLLSSCIDHSADHITDGTDCDDSNPLVNPLATEMCNGVDDDCNAATTEGAQVDGVQYASVAAAIAAAADGGTVELCAGAFAVANVTIDKVLTITGFGGDRDASTLDGTAAGNNAMLVVSGGELHLQSLTVANGKKGGAIVAKSGAVFADDCLFRDNKTPGLGGAIAGTDITISNSTFLRNEAASGGAVYASPPGVLTVTDSTFESNIATISGGGFYAQTTASFTGVDLFANVAFSDGGGGAVDAIGDTAVFTDTFFTANTALNGGGLWAFQTSVVADGTTTFDSNSAFAGGQSAYGGGAYMESNGQHVTWTGGLFVGNIADDPFFAAGGGLNLDNNEATNGGSITASLITLDGNHTFASTPTGGGLWTQGSPMILTDIVTMNNTSGYGGGTSLNSAGKDPVTLERVVYLNNVGVQAGATDVFGVNATMTDCTLENNVGDAVWAAVMVDTGGHLEVTNSELGSGATDNSPFDVIVSSTGLTYNYGSAASFVCDHAMGVCI